MKLSIFRSGSTGRPVQTRRLTQDLAAKHREEATVERCAEDYAIGQQQRADAARGEQGATT